MTGLARSFVIGVQVPGGLLGGWIAQHFGTDWMFAIAGGTMLVLGLVIARPLRRLLLPFQANVNSALQVNVFQPAEAP